MSSKTDYPWPNKTTSNTEFDLMSSEVVFADIDNDSFEDAVFVSESKESSGYILRVVRSGTFRELLNIGQLQVAPDLKIKMHLIDIDRDNSAKELMYVSADRTELVIMSLDKIQLGRTLLQVPLHVPLKENGNYTFNEKDIGPIKQIDLGHNSLVLDPEAAPQLEDNRLAKSGSWSEWSDWSDCTKKCGNGLKLRMRTCTQPIPRNGGQQCSGQGLETYSCRLKSCQPEDCGPNEVFNNGNCERDPKSSQSGRGDSSLGLGDGQDGGDSGPPKFGECNNGLVWDPIYFRCFKPHAINNIRLTWSENVFVPGDPSDDDDQGGYEKRVYTLPISLSHAKARGNSARDTANQYCIFRGYEAVLSYKTAIMNVGTNQRRAFILCDVTKNGYFYGGLGGCQIGGYEVSFTMKHKGRTYIQHKANEDMTYLKSVTCRKRSQ